MTKFPEKHLITPTINIRKFSNSQGQLCNRMVSLKFILSNNTAFLLTMKFQLYITKITMSIKYLFLKIWQKSQENTRNESLFRKSRRFIKNRI